MLVDFILRILEQGLIYAVMALGVYITYKILDFPDLSVDGTFPLGAVITAVMISKGANPYLTMPVAFVVGAFAGMLTGIIHVKCKVRDLLAGIIMSTALYSVNLKIASGKANVPIFTQSNIFTKNILSKILPKEYIKVTMLLLIVVVLKVLLDLFLKTRAGYLLRATGDNSTLVTSLGKDKGFMKIVGLSLANGLVALSGCLCAQDAQYSDVSMGTGMVVLALSSVIIGISIFKRISFVKPTAAVIIGSIVYKACYWAAINYGLSANDLKLITAMLFLIILVLTQDRKVKVRRNARTEEHL